MTSLMGRRAIVTGGAMGLGRAIAGLFAAEGARVTLADIDAAAGESAVRDIVESGGEARFVPCDVADADSVRAMVETALEAFGEIDILVNNAGIHATGSVVSTDEADWDRIIGVNLKGVYLCSKYALPHIAGRPGAPVVNIASVAGLDGLRDGAADNASKGGVVLLTKNMALDFAAQGVRVNCICPGATVTPMYEQGIASSDDPEATRAKITLLRPLGRLGEADEVARVALFLASDASSYMTGSVLAVDGGVTAQFAGQLRPGA